MSMLWGAMLYELLAGRRPFGGGTPLEMLMQVREYQPEPPSRWRPEIPRDLEAICLKCLEKEPERRYPTAAALADDLERFLAGQAHRSAADWWLGTPASLLLNQEVAGGSGSPWRINAPGRSVRDTWPSSRAALREQCLGATLAI